MGIRKISTKHWQKHNENVNLKYSNSSDKRDRKKIKN